MHPDTIWRFVRGTWTYELVSIDGQSVRVGTLLVAVALVGLGYRLSRAASGILKRVLRRRLYVEEGAADAIESLAFYLLFASVAITALRFVHFPLTVFTVVGGALAIGVGFGSQNIMSNFISGLILMLERPVRPGDLIEVDGTHGHVEHIGARSTRIRASNNTQIIVPNSFFLQSNVVNFTLSDDVQRSQVMWASPMGRRRGRWRA